MPFYSTIGRPSIDPELLIRMLPVGYLRLCARPQHRRPNPVAGLPPHGYLAKDDAPDASAFLPPPPEAGSLRQQYDVAIYHATRALEGTDRWRQAAADNEIETPSAPPIFNAALGVDFDPARMPTLALLLGRMLGDLETIQTPAKQGYSVLAPSSPNR